MPLRARTGCPTWCFATVGDTCITGDDVIGEGGRRAWPYDEPPQPLETSVQGLFAVGDVRRGSVKRVASAVGEGSVVVSAVQTHLSRRAPTDPAPGWRG